MTNTEIPFPFPIPITPAEVKALRAAREAVQKGYNPFELLEGSGLEAHLEQLIGEHGKNPEVIE